ncbi:MAG: hypothetical protein KGL52_11050 [Rhodospirillales bacterium]|jgi:hypothetical protein|nr:hypothetical protein [Rhodospirillales bacterium]
MGATPALQMAHGIGHALTVWAGWLCLAAALLGAVLAVLQLRSGGPPPVPWPVGALHGLLGAAGLALLVLALRYPDAAAPPGTGGFRLAGAVVLGVALLGGLSILATRLRRGRFGSGLVGVHATLAITGLCILAARLLAG